MRIKTASNEKDNQANLLRKTNNYNMSNLMCTDELSSRSDVFHLKFVRNFFYRKTFVLLLY